MKKILIDVNNDSYNIYIGNCLFKLKKYINEKKVFVITDQTVKDLYLDTLKTYINIDYLFTLGKKPESCKNLVFYKKCLNYCLENYLDKKTLVIAFGGGAVTDFASFFASTYKRGLELILLPTTLLSHDSSVGGKNALNIVNTKNAIGSIYQPKVVIYHIPFLKSLSASEVLSGFGEIFKHDLLSDAYLLRVVLLDRESIKTIIYDDKLIKEIICRAIIVKKKYIELDVYDNKGKRQFLNFGHTLGHALEISNCLSHGEAISLGMCFDMFLSNNSFYLSFYKKLVNWGYFKENIIFNEEEILNLIKNDKKNNQGKIKFIGLKEIGNPYVIILTIDEFKTKFMEFLRLIK